MKKLHCAEEQAFSLLKDAIAGADAFITSDIKYHQFFDADSRILLVDAGHFETEQFTMNLLKRFVNQKIFLHLPSV
ncbi:MAG: Nif3-like dinuclear metal center hexameric protein [Bacteroidia bacterium]